MNYLKRLFNIAVALPLTLGFVSLPACAFWPFDEPRNVVENFSVENLKLKTKDKDTKIAFVSDAFLYPVPAPSEKFPPPPTSKIGIVYKESQVLLQEAVRDLLAEKDLDLVIFGGSEVANQEHYRLFEDISYDLQKYGIDHYSMIGYGEATGDKSPREIVKQPYYLLEIEGLDLLVLDNVSEKIVPERLPEEASEQYIWLQKTLTELDSKNAELYVFSYYPLDAPALDLIKSYKNLKLVMLADSGMHKFSLDSTGSPTQLHNAALSIYPCAFTLIERKANGTLSVTVVQTRLKGVKRKASQSSYLKPGASSPLTKINK